LRPKNIGSFLRTRQSSKKTHRVMIKPIQTLTPSLEETLPLRIIRVQPKRAYPLHKRKDSIELVIVAAGTGDRVSSSQSGRANRIRIGTGDVFAIHEDESHSYENVDGLALLKIILQPLTRWLPISELFQLPGYYAMFHIDPKIQGIHDATPPFKLKENELSKVLCWVEQLEEEIEFKEEGYKFVSKGIIMQLLALICRSYPESHHSISFNRQTRANLGVAQALDFIENHYAEEISFERLRSIANMSHSGLLRAFRFCVDQSPIDYLIHTRIAKAKNLLANPNLNISEVSLSVGFNDPNYFTRKFKALTNLTPRQYRQTIFNPEMQSHPTDSEALSA
ncbi:MAG: AraC family transcriptional regulator, partial [Verrucomicrobiota bacterium]